MPYRQPQLIIALIGIQQKNPTASVEKDRTHEGGMEKGGPSQQKQTPNRIGVTNITMFVLYLLHIESFLLYLPIF